MIIGCCFICVFAVLINKVSLQVTVKAVIGGSAVLPCSSIEHDLKLQDTDVHWRHNVRNNVYDIIKGTDSVERQDLRYKNRVETFPMEYKGGIFSINLTHLTHGDAGNYICFITPSYELRTVQLLIKESTAEKEEIGPAKSVDLSLLPLLPLFILPIICSIVFYYRKKNQARFLSVTVTQMTAPA